MNRKTNTSESVRLGRGGFVSTGCGIAGQRELVLGGAGAQQLALISATRLPEL